MSLHVKPTVVRQLPSSVRNALGQMPQEQQAVFEEEYGRKRRNKVILGLLAIFFPIHFFFEDRIVLGLVYWLTIGGFGVWWLVEIFTVWGRTSRFNEDTAVALLRDMKIMGMAQPQGQPQGVVIDQRRMS